MGTGYKAILALEGEKEIELLNCHSFTDRNIA